MGNTYLTETAKAALLEKAYLVEGGKTVPLGIAYDVEGGKTVLLWSGGSAGGFIVISNNTYDATIYKTDDGITLEQIGTYHFGSTSGAHFARIIGDYLWMGGSEGQLVKMSLKDGTYTKTNPIYDLASGVSTYYTYTDAKEINGNIFVCATCNYTNGRGTYLLWSSDGGTTWTHHQLNTTGTYSAWVEYLNGVYYVLTDASSGTNMLYYGTDLVTWTGTSMGSASTYDSFGLVIFENRLVVVRKSSNDHYLTYTAANPGTSPTFTNKVTDLSFTLSPPKVANNILFLLEKTSSGRMLCFTSVSGSFTTLTHSGEVLYDIVHKDGLYLLGTSKYLRQNPHDNISSPGYFQIGNHTTYIKFVLARGE